MAVERSVDTLPSTADRGGPCPRCGRLSSFTLKQSVAMSEHLTVPAGPGSPAVKRWMEQVAVLVCQGCEEAVVVVEVRDAWGSPQPVMWWPMPGAGRLDESIPEQVAKAYGEGVRCLAVQVPNAAAAMLRSCLAQVVQDRGSDAAKGKRTLNDAIKQMVKDGALLPLLGEWAGHVREMGNAGAHPEVFGAVTQEEADELQRLVASLLEFLYVTPARVQRARAARAGS